MKGSSPSKLPLGEDVAVQDLMQVVVAHARSTPLAAVVDKLNQHLAEQGVSDRLEVQHSKAAAAGTSSSSGALFGTPLVAAAGRLAGMVGAAEQQQIVAPLSGAAGQQPASSPHSVLSGERGSDRRSSELFVTHDQLDLVLVQRELERVKEKNSQLKSKNSLLESENKAMQQQLSPIVPLVPSSAYVNRTRGSAGTPSPFNSTFGGQLGSGMRFSAASNGFTPLSAPRSGSMLDTSSAAASSSCFRGVPVAGVQAPGSVGSTRHSPQGQAVATPGTAPGSAASSAGRRAVGPVPMQPFDAAGSPAGRPSPVMQSPGQPAAKQLAEAIEKALTKQQQVSCCCCACYPAVPAVV
jgi:hypothetical protein